MPTGLILLFLRVPLPLLLLLASVAMGCTGSDASHRSADVDPAVKAEAETLIGRHIEDGIDWAEARDIDWRVVKLAGRDVPTDGSVDPNRLSFETDIDLIVSIDWS